MGTHVSSSHTPVAVVENDCLSHFCSCDRRFKDGSILETVLWGPSDAPPRLAHQLPGVILTHLLNRHFAGCSAVYVSTFGLLVKISAGDSGGRCDVHATVVSCCCLL